jgi:ABC-type nitrate/sulfonate/bicarbonate transport system ATPase subunit
MVSDAVEIHGLTFGYERQPIFREFNFTTDARLTIIRGPSGCGKTTLLKLIDGLLGACSSARIERPEPVFLVLQSDGLAPWLSGRENVELFSKELWFEVQGSPLFASIEPFTERPAHRLSFGQRRSIELARAFVCGYPLLLLDEPLNFLDRSRRSAFLEYMADPKCCSSRIVMTSHYDEGAITPNADIFEFTGDPPYSELVRAEL